MQTRIFLILSSFCFISFFSFGQDYKFIYYLDENLSSCEKAKSVFIGKALSEDGLIRLDCFNKVNGDLILSAHFTDSTLSTFQGLFQSFYPSKKIENEGNYLNGVENGVWEKRDTSGYILDSIVYDNGIQLSKTSSTYYLNGGLESFIVVDTIHNTFSQINYDLNGLKTFEAISNGNDYTIKSYDSTQKGKDGKLFIKTEIEASFPGSEAGWRRYLEKNLNPFVPIDNGAKQGTYTVIVEFIVDKDGSISDVSAETNYGFGMEEEVIRIIKHGPNWIPARQNGRFVRSLRKQPVTFVVQSQ